MKKQDCQINSETIGGVHLHYLGANPIEADTKDTNHQTLDIVTGDDAFDKIDDVRCFGNPNLWKMIRKISSRKENFYRSVKGFNVYGVGAVIMTKTVRFVRAEPEEGESQGRIINVAVSESTNMMYGCKLVEDHHQYIPGKKGQRKGYQMVKMCWLERCIHEIKATIAYLRGRR